MSNPRALALPYAVSKLLRLRSPDPIDAPGLVKIAPGPWHSADAGRGCGGAG